MEDTILFNTNNSFDMLNKSMQLNLEYIFGSFNCLIYLICSIFSIILNLPLILNWILNFKKNRYADFLLISISVSDFLNGFIVCPMYFIKKLIEMNLISSYVISKSLFFIMESVDYSIYLIGPASLFLLSLHRLKQLISPFKEGVQLNIFRIVPYFIGNKHR